ncbi:hypothetical protein EGY25_06325 [Brevundimonas intermedia]|uniref:Phytanoyl-CoA dioxygenase n=1 Tax=Brevundimonas intermedia TaxID=74315 RepID=A0A4Y9S0N6_9CAUL|nr:phytanoyl-CoA dioxygenase family protein [Brevundimonas intermedia]TFW13545.1 hypothetical protein EGY25_06325 [Brevundimonas intermedia]
MAFGDRILAQARQNSLQLEGLAANELKNRINEYLPPSLGARQMMEAYASYALNGKVSNGDYTAFRETFTETQGLSHQVFSRVLAKHIPQERYVAGNTMFQVDDVDNVVRGAVRSLQLKGMWKARFTVPDDKIEALKEKGMLRFGTAYGDTIPAMLAGADGCRPQVKSNYGWVTTIEEMYEISSDSLLMSIIQQYLGVPPIFDTPVMFLNSAAPVDDKGLSDTAQLYHHDLHRLQFVKLFIYLTDVDADSGPHAMIPGTHRTRPTSMWADGRRSDDAVKASGLLEDEVRITGKAGTLFLVDTSALHKGVHPNNNARLLAQVQYSNSLFGKPIPAATRILTQARGEMRDDPDTKVAASIVKRYAEKIGIRFMQGMI